MVCTSFSRVPPLLCVLLVASVFGPCAEAASAQSVGWLRDPRCGTSCDPVSHLCLAASTYKAWDACPAGAVEIERGEALDVNSCERSSGCHTSRACPLGNPNSLAKTYVSCEPSGCSGALKDCSKGGPAIITCCAMRTQVTCAAAFACTFGAAAAAQRRVAQDTLGSPPEFPGEPPELPPQPEEVEGPTDEPMEPPSDEPPEAPTEEPASSPDDHWHGGASPSPSPLPSPSPSPSPTPSWWPSWSPYPHGSPAPSPSPSWWSNYSPYPHYSPSPDPWGPWNPWDYDDVNTIGNRGFLKAGFWAELGSSLLGRITGSPILEFFLHQLGTAGKILGNVPIVIRWYAERWDGAIQPWVDYTLCSGSNRLELSDKVLDATEQVIRSVVVPPLKQFLFTTKTGSVVSEYMYKDLNLDVRKIDSAVNRENSVLLLEQILQGLKYLVADANGVVRDIISWIGNELLGENGRLTPEDLLNDGLQLVATLLAKTVEGAAGLGPEAGELASAFYRMEAKEADAFVNVLKWTLTQTKRYHLEYDLDQLPPQDTWAVRYAQPFYTLFPPSAPSCNAGGWNQPVSSNPVFVAALDALPALGDTLGLLRPVADYLMRVLDVLLEPLRAFWSVGRLFLGTAGKLLGLVSDVVDDSGLLYGLDYLIDFLPDSVQDATGDSLVDGAAKAGEGLIALADPLGRLPYVAEAVLDGLGALESLALLPLDAALNAGEQALGLGLGLAGQGLGALDEHRIKSPQGGASRRLLAAARKVVDREIKAVAKAEAEVAPQVVAPGSAARRLTTLSPERQQGFRDFVNSVERLRPAVANLVTALRASSQKSGKGDAVVEAASN
ncbi:hypothetical protein HYH03_005231 [Edaphochlamys debaryana]|uniref:Uncharacterized protein n=1 Tax=Edaphochlamys debaryana TaxID=47281 RepID=A0A836C1J8_9CHLO|nr:hypothetical protein HYH03_005231 [Edaphochlamys debaryana]|eukprot:KAG2496825.1 hypothetical protein HYH03_005231 [Edaphochlamys debaryana]